MIAQMVKAAIVGLDKPAKAQHPWMRSIDRAEGGRTSKRWQKSHFGKGVKRSVWNNPDAFVRPQRITSTARRTAVAKSKPAPAMRGYVQDGRLYADAAHSTLLMVLDRPTPAPKVRSGIQSLGACLKELRTLRPTPPKVMVACA